MGVHQLVPHNMGGAGNRICHGTALREVDAHGEYGICDIDFRRLVVGKGNEFPACKTNGPCPAAIISKHIPNKFQ